MPTIDIVVKSKVGTSVRARQLLSIFDVPEQEEQTLEWRGDLPLGDRSWNVGLIVGPSGCGKSTILNDQFGGHKPLNWGETCVVDDFDGGLSIQTISDVCQSVGFNTIPAWLRPFGVLSNGEKFRVEMARRLLESTDAAPIVMDEFTSVVDRQVAQIGSHAVQKFVRRTVKQFVAASCHYDIIDWLQPDWTLEPATMTFQWRCLRRRPDLHVEIARVDHSAWKLFAPYHYMSAELHKAAKCFVAFVSGAPAAFAGVLHRPHEKVDDIKGVSRLVTLPDYQGLGLAFVLVDALGAAYRALGLRLRTYPAHPALIRSFDRSGKWRLVKKPGSYSTRSTELNFGGRPCAVFEWAGGAMQDGAAATALVG